MKLTERIKKIRKLKGDKIKFSFNDEYFTQSGEEAEIIDIYVKDIYDIELIVKVSGILRPLEILKEFSVSREERLPLVKKINGSVQYYSYECDNNSVKNIFFTKNDYDSSLIKEFDEETVGVMEEMLRKLNINLKVKKSFTNLNPQKDLCKLYDINEETADKLIKIGLTPYGWRNKEEEIYFLSDYFDERIIYEINNSRRKIEELVVHIGLIKLTKERKK